MFGAITEKVLYDADGKTIRIIKTQDTEPLLNAIKERPDVYGVNVPLGKWLGTIPPLIAANWMKECGAAIGTREWNVYARKKLKSEEWRRLRAG